MEEVKKTKPLGQVLKGAGVFVISAMLVMYFVFMDQSRIGGQSPVAGSVDGKDVYYSKTSTFGRNYEKREEYYRENGVEITDAVRKRIERYAFDRAVEELLIQDRAKRAGIFVSDENVVGNIKGAYFTDSNGFNEQGYRSYVSRAPRSQKMQMEREVRSSLITETFKFELFQNIKVNPLEVEEEMLRKNNRRKVRLVFADAYERVARAEIASNTLHDYFVRESSNFMQYEIAAISVSSMSKAENIYRTLVKNPGAFAQTAKEKSDDAETKANGGVVGFFTKGDLPSTFLRQLSAIKMKPNTVAEPLMHDKKYYILLIKSTRMPAFSDVPLATVKRAYLEAKTDYLTAQEKGKLRAELEKQYGATKKFSDVARLDGFSLYESDYFSFGESVSDAKNGQLPPSSENVFHVSAFSLGKGGVSPVIDFESGVGMLEVVDAQAASLTNAATNDVQTLAYRLMSQKVNLIGNAWYEGEYAKARIVYKLEKMRGGR
ncbi:MAG: SurA N-terminal domain-containing protein [Spirochaetes bacterium]|nr:SurA N-terminal domain-containing protein [Spirochaetota bacterium]